MRTLSTPAQDSLTDETTAETWLMLVTISHASLAAPIRVVQNNENITSRGNEFIAYAFQVVLPGQGGDGPGEAQLSIDNTDRVIVDTLRSITDAADVLIEIILADTPDTVEVALPPLKLRDVTYNVSTVTGYLRFEDLVTEPACETITPSRFPALFALPLVAMLAQALSHGGVFG